MQRPTDTVVLQVCGDRIQVTPSDLQVRLEHRMQVKVEAQYVAGIRVISERCVW